MSENFLIFTPNPPSITSLPNSGKQSNWNELEKQLKIILNNYKIDDLTNQEMNLFSFFDEKLEINTHEGDLNSNNELDSENIALFT